MEHAMHDNASITQGPIAGALTIKQKLAYGCGDYASNLVWGLMISFLTYYYTDIYVLPAATVAWVLLIPRVFDALLDPVFGYFIDRTGGRHVVNILGAMAIPFGLATFLCFLPLPLSPTGKIAWAFVTYLILGAVYSAINTPYGVLSNMMATTPHERVSLTAFRVGGCQLGQLSIAVALLPAITRIGGGSSLEAQRSGVMGVAIAIGIVSMGLWLATWKTCKVRRPLPPERHSLRVMIGALARNRRFHLSNLLTFCNFASFCAIGGLAIHYTRFILDRPATDASFVLTAITVCAFIGITLVPVLVSRLGVRKTYFCLLAWQLAGLALIYASNANFAWFLAILACHSLAAGPISPLCYSILLEAIDDSRESTGIAAAGLAFSYNTLISKVAAGLAGFVIATFLGWGGYAPTLSNAGPALTFWLKAGFIGIPLCSVSLQFLLMLMSRPDRAPAGRTAR
jgi:glycoside/pentoside/hexuronide:cation symporter, GPH family